jgi:iron complex transport system substrate-binding protein
MSLRVVSLIASSTEIICALGAESLLVGRSHECDYPPSVRSLPCCTEPRFPTEGSSKEIDQKVRDVLAEALSVYRVDPERIRELRPDVIVTQDHCRVCAVSLDDVNCALSELLDYSPRVVSLHPDSLDDVWRDIRHVASALDLVDRGEALVAQSIERLEALRDQRAPTDRPSVACIEWVDPLMASGNWIPEIVEIAGGRNLFGEAGKHSPMMKWEDLVEANPDVLVILPCGFEIRRTALELPVLARRPEWRELECVRRGRVYLCDGNSFFNRPGPRVVDSACVLHEIFFGEQQRKFDRTVWVKVSHYGT